MHARKETQKHTHTHAYTDIHARAHTHTLVCPSKPSSGICRGCVPDIEACGTHRIEDLVNAIITSNAEEEEEEEEQDEQEEQEEVQATCLRISGKE